MFPSKLLDILQASEIFPTIELLAFSSNQEVQQNYLCLTMKYGADHETVNVYYKQVSVGTPIVVYVHTTGCPQISSDSATFYVGPIAEKGYRAMVVNMDNFLANPKVPDLQAPLLRLRGFILNYAKKTFAKHVCFMGHLAGAQLLVAMLDKTLENEPNADMILTVGLITGIYELPVHNSDIGWVSETNINDRNIPKMPEDFTHLRSLPISFDLYSTERDGPFLSEQSRSLQCMLKKSGVQSELTVLPNVDYLQALYNLKLPDFPPIQNILEKFEEKRCGRS